MLALLRKQDETEAGKWGTRSLISALSRFRNVKYAKANGRALMGLCREFNASILPRANLSREMEREEREKMLVYALEFLRVRGWLTRGECESGMRGGVGIGGVVVVGGEGGEFGGKCGRWVRGRMRMVMSEVGYTASAMWDLPLIAVLECVM